MDILGPFPVMWMTFNHHEHHPHHSDHADDDHHCDHTVHADHYTPPRSPFTLPPGSIASWFSSEDHPPFHFPSLSTLSDWVGLIASWHPGFFELSWSWFLKTYPDPDPPNFLKHTLILILLIIVPPTLSPGMDGFLADWSHFARVREDTPDPSHTPQLPLSSDSHQNFQGTDTTMSLLIPNWFTLEAVPTPPTQFNNRILPEYSIDRIPGIPWSDKMHPCCSVMCGSTQGEAIKPLYIVSWKPGEVSLGFPPTLMWNGAAYILFEQTIVLWLFVNFFFELQL